MTAAGSADRAFREISVSLVPTLHGERFTVPAGGELLAEETMLRREGTWLRFPMAFRYGLSYGFQFEPQRTLDELRVWNRELAEDYELMGDRFDPAEEAARDLREFTAFAPLRTPDGAHGARVPAAKLPLERRRHRLGPAAPPAFVSDRIDLVDVLRWWGGRQYTVRISLSISEDVNGRRHSLIDAERQADG